MSAFTFGRFLLHQQFNQYHTGVVFLYMSVAVFEALINIMDDESIFRLVYLIIGVLINLHAHITTPAYSIFMYEGKGFNI